MKPYRRYPISECGEALKSLRDLGFVLTDPHPYQAFGAPYDSDCPWVARASVVQALEAAHKHLQTLRPDWTFRIFDAYRPTRIQSFMVMHEFRTLSGGRAPEEVPPREAESLWEKTYRIWAEPSENPLTPPPHATGAALDLTLVHPVTGDIPMGSPIDENSERSLPDHFQKIDPAIHENRECLREVMTAAGFERHPEEWWHFCLGDQMWAWLRSRRLPDELWVARYGRYDQISP